MAADPVFVDTNVLVYATRPSSAEHAARAALTGLEGEGSTLWVSHQVLREYLAVVTQPQVTASALPMTTAIADELVGSGALTAQGSYPGRVPSSGIDTVTVWPTKEILLKVCASRERQRQADNDNSAKKIERLKHVCLRDNRHTRSAA
jgi:hypothetical protein